MNIIDVHSLAKLLSYKIPETNSVRTISRSLHFLA